VGFNASVQNLVAISDPDQAIIASRFGGNLPLAYGPQMARIPGVTNVSHVGVVNGYFRERKNFAFVIMEDAAAPAVLTDFTLTRAQWDQLQKTRDGVFVSRKIAARYNLKPGDTYPILTAASTRADGGKLWLFHVLGVVDEVPRYLNGLAVGNYDYLDQSSPAALRGTAGEFQLRFSSPALAESEMKDIDALFANSPVPTNSMTQKEISESSATAGVNIPFVTTVVASAGLFMILFLTGNGIAQSVRERIPEFAMLKTLGFPDAGVMALIFVEAAIPCLLGAAIGIALALAWARQVPHLFPPGVLSLPAPTMSPSVLSLAFVFALIVALLSTVLPALRIRRLDVATALSGR
jgi:putative ABC transport system permease protein